MSGLSVFPSHEFAIQAPDRNAVAARLLFFRVEQKERAMDETRLESAKGNGSWKDGWLGAAMGLMLIAGALLTIGGAPAPAPSDKTSATVSAEASAAAPVANADADVLDLQLD